MNSFNPFDPKYWTIGQPRGFQSVGPRGDIINSGGVNLADPRTASVLGIAQGLLGAGGWSPQPVSFGQAMGQGLGMGVQSYRSAVRDAQLQIAAKAQEGIQNLQRQRLQAQADAIAALPESQQQLANIDPGAFARAQQSELSLCDQPVTAWYALAVATASPEGARSL